MEKSSIYNLKQPEYFHRENENDMVGFQNSSIKRYVSIALPFLGLCKRFNRPLSLCTNSLRAVSNGAELYQKFQNGSNTEIAYQCLQTGVSVLAVAGTFFAHPAGMLITTVHDIAIQSFALYGFIFSQDKNYYKAGECGISILNNVLYLGLFINGGAEILIVSLSMQIIAGLVHSKKEFEKGYLEGFAGLAMCGIRAYQIAPGIQMFQTIRQYKKNEEGLPVLHYAVKQQNQKVTKFLVEQCGANVNEIEQNQGKTPIHFAVETGNKDSIEYLLQKGANINALDKLGYSVFHYAVRSQNPNSIPLLRKYTPDSNLLSYQQGGTIFQTKTALALACKLGKKEMIKACIDAGADVMVKHKDYYTYEGRGSWNTQVTAIHYAVEKCDQDTIQYMVKNIQSDEAFRDVAKSVIVDAADYGNVGALKCLIPLLPGYNSESSILAGAAISKAKMREEFGLQGKLDCINYLAEQGHLSNYSVRMSSSIGFFPSYDILKFLLDKGYLDLQKNTAYGTFNFSVGEYPQGIDMCKLLIERGADIYEIERSISANSLLHRAAASNDPYAITLIELLLQRGMDINCENTFFSTPLDMARNPEIQAYLIERGAKKRDILSAARAPRFEPHG